MRKKPTKNDKNAKKFINRKIEFKSNERTRRDETTNDTRDDEMRYHVHLEIISCEYCCCKYVSIRYTVTEPLTSRRGAAR